MFLLYIRVNMMGNGALWMGYIPEKYNPVSRNTRIYNAIEQSILKKQAEAKKKLEESRKYSISALTVTDEQRKKAKFITGDSLDTDRKLALMQLDMVINRQKAVLKKGLSKEIESKINDDAVVLIKIGVIKLNTVKSAVDVMVDSYL